MKKELPKVFQNRIVKPINNNDRVFYGDSKDSRKSSSTVDELFKPNEIYRTNARITLKDRTIDKKIIGRTQNNLITIDNEIIPISEIIQIETV
jgi:hypothetical protein